MSSLVQPSCAIPGCPNRVGPGKRLFCRIHSANAGQRSKKRAYEQEKFAHESGKRPLPAYVTRAGFRSIEEYRVYMAARQREYRARRKKSKSKTAVESARAISPNAIHAGGVQ